MRAALNLALPSFGSTQIELRGRHFDVKSGKCVSNVEEILILWTKDTQQVVNVMQNFIYFFHYKKVKLY